MRLYNQFSISFFILFLSSIQFAVTAQDLPPGTTETIETDQIDVVKAYEPVLEDAVRITFSPDLPSVDSGNNGNGNPVFNDYSVPNRFLKMPYEPSKLKPISYKPKKAETEKLYHAWLKAGFGNIKTPFIDLSLSSGKWKKFLIGAKGGFISSNGKPEHKDYSNADGEIFSRFFMKGATIKLGVNYDRDTYFHYGYDHSDSTLTFSDENLRKRYQTIGGSFGLENSIENRAEMDYRFDLNFKRLNNNLTASENNIIINGKLDKRIGDNIQVGAILNQHFSSFKRENLLSVNDLMFGLTPTFTYLSGIGKFSAGFSAIVSDKKFYPFPYLDLEGYLVPNKLSIFAKWNKKPIKNNYLTLTEENPFLREDLTFQNTIREERILGVKASVTHLVSLEARFVQERSKFQALFLNQPGAQRLMYTVYDSLMNSIGGDFEIGFHFNKRADVALKMGYRSNEVQNLGEAFHIPTFQSSLLATVTPIKNLLVRAELFAFNGYKALDDFEVVKVKGGADLNLEAEYRLFKNLAFFLKANNIASIKYQRYFNYKTYGLNVIGGFALRF